MSHLSSLVNVRDEIQSRRPSQDGQRCPRAPRRTRPSLKRDGTTISAVLIGTAKLRPLPPAMIAVLTPTTRPSPATSGPPEFPGFSAASVWITCSIRRPERDRKDRPSALTTPAVTVCWKPYGFPI